MIEIIEIAEDGQFTGFNSLQSPSDSKDYLIIIGKANLAVGLPIRFSTDDIIRSSRTESNKIYCLYGYDGSRTYKQGT